MESSGRVIAVLGAESTGKSALAQALSQAWARSSGQRVACVDEWLRHWCHAHRRTPQPHEQAAIAQEQTRRILAACTTHDWVVADTTALMTALYSAHLFGDESLRQDALAWQRGCALTLVTENDLPWQADGLQRDGPQVRDPVRARLVQWLQQAGIAWSPVAGTGPDRLKHALQAAQVLLPRAPGAAGHCTEEGEGG